MYMHIQLLDTARHNFRGDVSVCPLGGFIRALGCLISDCRGVPPGAPQRQTLNKYTNIYIYIYMNE